MRLIIALFAAASLLGMMLVIGEMELSGSTETLEAVKDADFEKIENSIIIHGITGDARERSGIEETAEAGRIIIDNSFHETIVQKENRPVSSFAKEFASLKRKDIRWHLSKYTIRRGDNLYSIAGRFDTDHRLIIKANNITNPDMLSTGKSIQVPNRYGIRYRVKKGDTLGSIAARYSSDIEVIKSHNRLASRINAGTSIFIPGAREPVKSAKSPAVRSRRESIAAKEPKAVSRKGDVAFRWPARGRITSSFGNRSNPLTGERSFHTGMDIGLSVGTPIKAAADGKVIYSGWKDIYGNMVILKHDKGYITVYAHNKTNLVLEDDNVKAGDVIARSGMTGSVTGPHLHFEIRKHLTPLNPRRFLR